MSTLDHDPLTILYATETGNAQDISDRISRQCRRIHLEARVHSMDAYAPSDLISETLVIFVVSTTGSGKEPRAMTPLWNLLLRSDLPEDLFEDLDFAVFGLGDTAYEKFCWPAKLLSRRLESLGATELCARGEGDDQHPLGADGAFEPWLQKLSGSLLALYPLPPGIEIPPRDRLFPPRVSLTDADEASPSVLKDSLVQDRKYHTATLKSNRRITAEGWYQDVRHFEFEFDEDIQYNPGDVLVIHPEAAALDVDALLVTLGFANTADEPFTILHTLSDQSLPDHLPRATTLRALFTRYLDIAAVPRRSFFALLRHFVSDELEREKLNEFLSVEGADEMYEYCQRPRRTIHEVLDEFRSARVPREYVFDLFPPLRPREFSIASSIRVHPRHVHLCVAIVQYKTMLKIPRRGVCTSFLARLSLGDTLRVGLKKGLLTLPEDAKTPVICVGPGTGVAPMRALIEERAFAGAKNNTLYFGCRSATKDQHYHAEWEEFVADGELTYRTAFSRDGPPGVARTYVQDLIREDAARVWELLQKGVWVYISGSSNKMPAGVRAALRYVVQKEGGKTEEEAREYVAVMEREGRLTEECWS